MHAKETTQKSKCCVFPLKKQADVIHGVRSWDGGCLDGGRLQRLT